MKITGEFSLYDFILKRLWISKTNIFFLTLEMAIDKTLVISSNGQIVAEGASDSVTGKDNVELHKPEYSLAVMEKGTQDRAALKGKNSIISTDEVPETNENEGLPIDRGWAWVVLAGATFYLMLFGGIRKNFGIFFVAFQDRFGSTASLTSFLTTMQNLVISFSSLLIMTVGMQFMSNRVCIIVGSLFLTTANLITAYSTDIRMLFLSVGFLEGAGTALIHPPVTATLGEYFHKRRGLANGLAFSGASFGGLVFAPIMSALFEDTGYTGTLTVVAGMTFNILITGALLRPIQSFERRPIKNMKNEADEKSRFIKETSGTKDSQELFGVKENELLESSHNVRNRTPLIRNETDKILKQLVLEKENVNFGAIQNRAVSKLKADAPSPLKIVRSDSYDQHTDRSKMLGSPLLPRTRAWSVGNRRPQTFSQNSISHKTLSPLNNLVESLSRSRVALYSSADGICGSVIDIQEISPENESENKTDMKSVFLSKLKASFDTTLFRNRIFPIFLCMAAMFAPTCGLLPTFLAPLAKDLNLSADQVGLLMAVVGGVGTASRILCALFADRKLVKLTTILAVAASAVGILAHCVRFFKSFSSLVFMAVVLGLCCEIYQSMYAVILVEYLTLPKLKSCIGFTVLCHGLAVASTFPVVGALRDATGNYIASYHFLGTMSIVGAILASSLPYVHKRQQKQKAVAV